jgi:hypothetical protein
VAGYGRDAATVLHTNGIGTGTGRPIATGGIEREQARIHSALGHQVLHDYALTA